MSFLFKQSEAKNASELRIMNKQWAALNDERNSAEEGKGSIVTLISMISKNDPVFANTDLAKKVTGTFAANEGASPAEAYKEFDSTTKIDMVPDGEHATLTRLMPVARSVDLGRIVFEYRKATRAGENAAQSSISGQKGVKLDHVDYQYGNTVVPVHDIGYGRNFREALSMQADGFDALVDDGNEAERSLLDKVNDYLFEGDEGLVVKGAKWLGLKNDTSVAQAVLAVDLSDSATTPEDIRNEVKRIRDILRITNNCTKDLKFGVSREIMSNWERMYSQAEGMFGTIEDMIAKLRGIAEIYEDSKLLGNEVIMYWADQQGFHPVVGMALHTEAIERTKYNDDFNFIKAIAVGFVAKTDAEGRTCALYAA